MSPQVRVVALIVIILVVLLARSCCDRTEPAAISFVATIDDTGATIDRFIPDAVLKHRPRLHAMRLRDRGWATAPLGATELIVGFLDSGGRSVGTAYGYPDQNPVFVDRGGSLRDRGGRRQSRSKQRVFHLPVPAGAKYVGLFRHRVVDEDPRTTGLRHDAILTSGPPERFLVKTVLRVAPLDATVVTVPPPIIELPGSDGGHAAAATDSTVINGSYSSTEPPAAVQPPMTADGTPPEITMIRTCGENADCYNIVVVGDGFKHAELSTYADKAEELIAALLSTPPMSDYAESFNVYLVSTASTDSGIS